ncbi:glycosyltransferase family 39 protein [Syntrophomonas palmitatica]|uniref:glycosyltransferase family 39 protein n=1 Tax=Syntrophomonas palmitatica TaxID=402877 RepID=UPI0006D2405C|nr:glycosyltransferase family 39 protein [Syntrophomonas palmitatica]
MVIASRLAAGLGRADGESIIRRLMGKAFNLMVQALVLPGIRDSQCGLKGFHYQAARPIFSRQRLNGFAFDVEVLALARALKIPIKELPLRVKDCPGSTVNRILTPLQMAVDIIYLKLAFFINEYRLPGGYQPLREAATIMTLFFAALALRLPWLWEIPRFIDELKEVRLSYLIFTGQALPLHNAAHDIGAMHNYILAIIFKLLGPGIYWPRLYVACCSALTVIVVYLLGRILFGRTTGLLTSVFLMFNGMNILTSHMAWANCTTPFFFTLAMLSTILAEQKRNGWWLAAAGLLWAAPCKPILR